MSGVSRARSTPDVAAIRGNDEMQHVPLRATHVCIRCVEGGR
jgi:hypothetical protein